jgi:hypothetical protein
MRGAMRCGAKISARIVSARLAPRCGAGARAPVSASFGQGAWRRRCGSSFGQDARCGRGVAPFSGARMAPKVSFVSETKDNFKVVSQKYHRVAK